MSRDNLLLPRFQGIGGGASSYWYPRSPHHPGFGDSQVAFAWSYVRCSHTHRGDLLWTDDRENMEFPTIPLDFSLAGNQKKMFDFKF
jgi:hypothetical protein